MLQEDSYITIQAFMRNKLNLKGNELLVYAIIYGFSQDNNSKFTGSASYIAEWLGISRRAVMDILKKLTDKQFITKYKRIQNNTTFCDYAANFIGYEKTSQGGMKKLHTPYEETSHHNIEDNIERNKRFTKPTVEEISAYISANNYDIDADNFFDFYESKGWVVGKSPMKDWKAAIRTWVRKRKEDNNDSEYNPYL